MCGGSNKALFYGFSGRLMDTIGGYAARQASITSREFGKSSSTNLRHTAHPARHVARRPPGKVCSDFPATEAAQRPRWAGGHWTVSYLNTGSRHKTFALAKLF